MKASQIGWIISTALIVATVVGCGSNGDPGKKYDNVKASATVKAEPGVPSVNPTPSTPPTPAPVANLDCNDPVTIKVDKDSGNRLLVFPENTETTFTINVRSNLGTDFKVDAAKQSPDVSADLHAGRAKFASVSTNGINAVYTLTWKPGKLSSGQKSILPFALTFTSGAGAKCDINKTEILNLVVQAANTGDAK